MAYDNDIYISLASGSHENSWEKNLIIFLNTLLKRLLSRSIKMVHSSDFTTDEQRQKAISESAAFLLIITDEYIKSDYAAKEIELIFKSIHGSQNKIFKVLKTDIDSNQQPSQIRNILSYNFFEKVIDQDDAQTYYESKIFEIERHYWSKLTDLAFDIFNIIQLDRSISDIPGIYIAETSDDQNKNRESILRELKRLGHVVYPDKVLSTEIGLLKKEVYDYLQKSFVSIHLVGSNYGSAISGSEFSNVELQNQIASDYFEMLQGNDSEDITEQKFSRLIWLDPDLKISNETQKIFIEKLRRDTDILKGASMIQTPLEHFKSIVISEIKHKQIQKLHSFSKISEGIKVYLIHESQSFEKISTISAQLVRSGFEILHSPMLNEERNLLKKHRQNLIDCDAVLIFYDSNDAFWLKSKIYDLMKAPGYGRKRPFAAKAVLIDCDNTLPTDFFANREFIVMHNLCNSPLYSLDKFLDKIQMTYV